MAKSYGIYKIGKSRLESQDLPIESGIQSLNSLTASTQTFSVGSSGSGPNFSSSGSVHTLNIPNAGPGISRGLITNESQSIYGTKTLHDNVTIRKTIPNISLTSNGNINKYDIFANISDTVDDDLYFQFNGSTIARFTKSGNLAVTGGATIPGRITLNTDIHFDRNGGTANLKRALFAMRTDNGQLYMQYLNDDGSGGGAYAMWERSGNQVTGYRVQNSANVYSLMHRNGHFVSRPASGSQTNMEIYNGANLVGTITSTTTTTSYNTTSDPRLKDEIEFNDNILNKIKNVPVRKFTFKGDTQEHIGFFSTDLEDVFPFSVTGERNGYSTLYKRTCKETGDVIKSDEEIFTDHDLEIYDCIQETIIKPQQVDHSKLVPVLFKAIQELSERLDILEGNS